NHRITESQNRLILHKIFGKQFFFFLCTMLIIGTCFVVQPSFAATTTKPEQEQEQEQTFMGFLQSEVSTFFTNTGQSITSFFSHPDTQAQNQLALNAALPPNNTTKQVLAETDTSPGVIP